MLEFLRLGLPVLGTRVGGATDILEGGAGVIVDPKIDAEELAEVRLFSAKQRTGAVGLIGSELRANLMLYCRKDESQ